MTVCVAAAGKPGMGLMGPMGLMGKNVPAKSEREKREAGVLPRCPANVRENPCRPWIGLTINVLFIFLAADILMPFDD